MNYGFRLTYELDDTSTSHHLLEIGCQPTFFEIPASKTAVSKIRGVEQVVYAVSSECSRDYGLLKI